MAERSRTQTTRDSRREQRAERELIEAWKTSRSSAGFEPSRGESRAGPEDHSTANDLSGAKEHAVKRLPPRDPVVHMWNWTVCERLWSTRDRKSVV